MHKNVRNCQATCQLKATGSQHVFLNEAGEHLSFMKKAEYIGSFLVTGSAHYERAEIVRQKLEAARAYTQSKPILLVISLHGIKICDDSGTSVHMAHALRRISYATCDPDCCQFAFLAREPKAQPNVQYCHAFVTETPDEAENLNSIVGEAFRIAYAQQRALLEGRRAATQAQTVSVTVAGDAASPPPATAYPVTELDSGIATANASSFRKVDTGYAADSGLSSSESASRVPKPRPIHGASDGDERHPLARKPAPSGVDESIGESPTGPVSSKVIVTQSHRCQLQNDTEFSAPNKREKAHKLVRSTRIGQGPHETGQRDQSDSPSRRPEVGGVGCGDDDDDGFAQPTSAPHPTPLPVTSDALNADTDEVELAKSLAAIPNLVERRRPIPLSPSSSINAYDQASEAHRNPPFPPARRRQTPSDRCVSFSSTALVQVDSDGGGGGNSSSSSSSGANSLKTSAGIATGPEQAQSLHSNQLASAPWYQPNIPRDLALDMLARQPPGSFIVRDSATHSNCYALSVRVGNDSFQAHATERCLSAGMTPRTSAGGGGGAGGAISHYLIQRTSTGVRLKGLEKEWPSLPCLILHLTVMPEMLPCPLLGLPQSSSNPSAFLGGHQHHPHFEQAPDSCSFRPISTGADPRPATPLPANSEYQQLSEFSSILADLDNHDRRRRQRRQPPPPPPARIR